MSGDASHELGVLRGAVEEMRANIVHLTRVIQEEQETRVVNEAAAAADRARLEGAERSLSARKLQADEHLHGVGATRKDLASLDARLREACARLDSHDGLLSGVRRELDDSWAQGAALAGRAEVLEAQSGELLRAVAEITEDGRQRRADLEGLRDSLTQLDCCVSEADERLRETIAAQEFTAHSLRQAVDATLAPAVERAEAEKARLDGAVARLSGLEASGREAAEAREQLRAADERAAGELRDVRGTLKEVAIKSEAIGRQLARTGAEVEVDRERLEDVCLKIDVLQDGSLQTGASLRAANEAAAESQAACRRQAAQVDAFAGTLAALRGGLAVTDRGLFDLRAMLDVPEPTGAI